MATLLFSIYYTYIQSIKLSLYYLGGLTARVKRRKSWKDMCQAALQHLQLCHIWDLKGNMWPAGTINLRPTIVSASHAC